MKSSLFRLACVVFLLLGLVYAAPACDVRSGKNHPPVIYGWDTGPGPGTGGPSVDIINFEDYFWPLYENWNWLFVGNTEYNVYSPVIVGGYTEAFPMFLESAGLAEWAYYFTHDQLGMLYEVRFAWPGSVYWDHSVPLIWGKRYWLLNETITSQSDSPQYDYVTGAPTGRSKIFLWLATYIGKEVVTVPAGTFNDCIVVNYVLFEDGNPLPTVEFFYWFSWGDGIVMFQYQDVSGTYGYETLEITYP